MRQTLLHIPHQIGPWPLFGFGWLLVAWAVVAAIILWRAARQGGQRAVLEQLPFVIIVAAIIGFVLPFIEERGPDGTPLGLPIRFYGVMMLLGVVSGVGTAAYRAHRVGLDPEVIFSLAFWMFVFGVTGARLFYLVQYWETFQEDSILATVGGILNFTRGGLVVYGSVIGGLLAGWIFVRVKRLPTLAMADLIAPSMALGLALGRIGCLLNGCCHGGVCEQDLPAVRFPPGSPPYMQQLHDGHLLGMHLKTEGTGREQDVIVEQVHAGSSADQKGVVAGTRYDAYLPPKLKQLQHAIQFKPNQQVVALIGKDGPSIGWTAAELPRTSMPTHPAQIYASINAFLLFSLTWFLFPLRRRDGVVFATLMTLYPISRILEEMIRSDEGGQLGTALTISQWVSVGILIGAAAIWVYIARQKSGASWTTPGDSV